MYFTTENCPHHAKVSAVVSRAKLQACVSYYNVSLTDVRPASSRPFMDRQAPNLVGRSGVDAERG